MLFAFEDTAEMKSDQAQANEGRNVCKMKRVYITGDVGAGKSAFCKMMIHTWCSAVAEALNDGKNDTDKNDSNLNEMKKFEFLFHIPMRITTVDKYDIQEMVKSFCPQHEKLVKELFEKESEKCMILIDGLDEWNHRQEQKRRRSRPTEGIPVADKIQGATIITTSRPSAHGILNMNYSEYDRKVKLIGIDKTAVQCMAEKYIKAMNKDLNSGDFMKTLELTGIPQPEKSPMLLQQILWMYCNGIKIGKSVTDIYSIVVNITFAWFEEKDTIESTTHLMDISEDLKGLTLPKVLQETARLDKHTLTILALGKIAFQTLTSGMSVTFGSDLLKRCAIQHDAMTRLLNVGFIFKENCWNPTSEKTQFSFIHRSFRDFFAAVYIASSSERDGKRSEIVLQKLFENFESVTVANSFQLSSVLVMVCGLDQCLRAKLSTTIHEAILNDEQRKEYIANLEDSVDVSPDLLQQTLEVQHFVLQLSESQACDSKEIPWIRICDVVIRSDTNLSFMHHIIPEHVQSLEIGINSIHDEVLEVIENFSHIQVLSIRTVDGIQSSTHTTSFVEQDLKRAESLVQTILYNDGIVIDLSQHKKLQCISLQRCKHLSVSPTCASALRSCTIRGFVIQHEQFNLISSCFAIEASLEDLTLEDVKCDQTDCRGHDIDLSRNEKMYRLTLDDCKILRFSISTSARLQSINIRRCCLSHSDCEELLTCLEQTISLQDLELYSVRCDSVECKGHNIDLSAQENLKTLSLVDCRHVSVSGASSTVKSCTICRCNFSHEQCTAVSAFVVQAISLQKLVLLHISCDKSECENHSINLLRQKQLQSLDSMDICLYPSRLNTTHLARYVSSITKMEIPVPDGVQHAPHLSEYTIEALTVYCVYTEKLNSTVHTFKNLQKLVLRRIIIEHNALTVSKEMENLKHIELWEFKMSMKSWETFVNSLENLQQCVEVRTSSMDITTTEVAKTAVEYVKSRNHFEIVEEPSYAFCFKVKR